MEGFTSEKLPLKEFEVVATINNELFTKLPLISDDMLKQLHFGYVTQKKLPITKQNGNTRF